MVRFLGSTKLAIALCLLLAAGGIAGSLLYKGNTAFGNQGAFPLFRSPLFLFPAGLLVLNVLFCAIPKVLSSTFRAPGAWTFVGLHAGLLLLVFGMAADGLLGWVGTQYFSLGVPHAGYHNWKTGKEESFPFTVEVTDAETRYHPVNLRIGVRKTGGEKVGLYTVREGISFSADGGGLVVTPRRFDAGKKALLLDASSGGRTEQGLLATMDGSAEIGGYVIQAVAFADPEPSDLLARIRIARQGEPPVERSIRINHPATYGGISFCIVNFTRDQYQNPLVGLQMTREPGERLFWAGAILFGISLIGHLLAKGAKPERVRVEGDGSGGAERKAVPAGVVGTTICIVGLLLPGASHAFGTVIDRDATWEGEVRITEPVTVEKGALLRILPGTRVLLSGEDRDGDGYADGSIQVFGELRVEGEKGRPVRFGRMTPGSRWQEIFLKDARATIRHAVVEGAVWGLHIHDGDVRVEDSSLRGNGGGVRMRGAGATFTRCSFVGNGIGLRFWNGGPRVSASMIEGNGTGLFYRDGTGGGKITGTRIANREWDVKIGEWATGDLDLSGNYWGAPGHPKSVGRVRDYRERKGVGTVSFERPLTGMPPGAEGERGR